MPKNSREIFKRVLRETAIMTIYLAQYNPDIYESATAVISVHRTKEGAEKAIAWYKHAESWSEEDWEIEAWFVIETTLEE